MNLKVQTSPAARATINNVTIPEKGLYCVEMKPHQALPFFLHMFEWRVAILLNDVLNLLIWRLRNHFLIVGLPLSLNYQ
jgi:hypothetical protein